MFGYDLADQYGSLGPLSSARLGRTVFSRNVMPMDPDGSTSGVIVTFNISIPALDLTKGLLLGFWTGVSFVSNFQWGAYVYNKSNPHIYWVGDSGFATWNNSTKVLTFELNSSPPNIGIGKYFHGVMFA